RPCAEATVLPGILQEIHDLVDLGLDFVDASHIIEVHPDRFGIDQLLRVASQQSTAHGSLLALEHPDVETHEEEEWRKRDEQVGENATMLDQRRRSYDGATAGQLRQQVIAGKRRAFSRELLIGTVLLARNRYCLFELPLDRISLGKQLGDILVRDLRLELCVRNRFGSRESILNSEEAEEQQISNDPDPSVNPAAPRIRR